MNNMKGEWKQTDLEHTLILEAPSNKYHCRCLAWFIWGATLEEATKQHARHVRKVT